MERIRLLVFIAFATHALPATSAGFDYDLLIVACDRSDCQKVAERTVAGGPTDRTEYSQDGLTLAIEAVARRSDAVDARISLDVRPLTDRAAALRSDVRQLARRVQIFVEPCTLRRGAFSSVAAFVSDGIIYRVWARLAAVR